MFIDSLETMRTVRIIELLYTREMCKMALFLSPYDSVFNVVRDSVYIEKPLCTPDSQ